MRNWLMSLLVELGKARRFDVIAGGYDSYCAYNLTLDSFRTCAVLPWNAPLTRERCNRTHRPAP